MDKGSVEGDVGNSDSQAEVNSSDSNRKKKVVDSEKMFRKLKKNPAARVNLASVHSARSYKYGLSNLGQKTGT